MPGVVDADTHVLEHEGMWENFDGGGSMYPYRPLLVTLPEDTSWGGRNAFWLIDGEIVPKSAGRGRSILHTPTTAKFEMERTDIALGARLMTDTETRLNDMDRLGVEIQVVYPTLFLILQPTESPELEGALCRAYNRYMAKACAKANGRLRFVMVPPLRAVDKCIEEMNWGKEHGAVGLLFRAIEGDRTLADPYFDPIYQEASRLNLPVCVHLGDGRSYRAIASQFNVALTAGVGVGPSAFTAVVTGKVPERHPDLRIGFIELGSMWVPDAVNRIRGLSTMNLKGAISFTSGRYDKSLFKDYRIYFSCFVEEELPWVLNYVGEDNLIIGSDYSHQDPSEEMNLVQDMRGREDGVPPSVIEKILCENARNFYPL
jgi:predicted TIM-barrel fold metal-dependent hydrolase